MRFEVSRVLDAIERRLSIDPVVASAAVDLTEIMHLGDLDGGRPANLLRLGLIVDALGQRLGDSAASIYAVAERGLISDTELTSNERMVIRRWSDDGLIEVLPAKAPVQARLREISALTGLAMITRIGGAPMSYAPVPAAGGISLVAHAGAGAPPARTGNPVLGRQWHCPEPDCASFGSLRSAGQPPPTLRSGAPTCPRHGNRLVDGGPRPIVRPIAARVDGLVRERFTVGGGRSLIVGRAPEDRSGIALGPYLDEAAVRWISRNHIRLELRGEELIATDQSTNGTTILHRPAPGAPVQTLSLTSGQSRAIGEWDIIRLHKTVEIARADRLPDRAQAASPDSVMADAPTMAIRLPTDIATR
ncbi:MAG TPA: FHA domain-containing protein [Micromonosporaceae bacterium]